MLRCFWLERWGGVDFRGLRLGFWRATTLCYYARNNAEEKAEKSKILGRLGIAPEKVDGVHFKWGGGQLTVKRAMTA